MEAGTTQIGTSLRAEFAKDWAVLPNLITEVRLVCSPVAAILILLGEWRWAFVLFVLISATDKIDGYIARKYNLVTLLGTALDPIVDKVLVGTTLIALSVVQPLVLVPTIIISIREMSVFLMLKRVRRAGRDIGTIYSGKVKMVVQCVAIAMLILPFHGAWQMLTWSVVGASVVLTLTSWSDYLKAYNKR